MIPRITGWPAISRTAALLLAAALALCPGACSSSKSAKRSEFGPTYKERLAVMDKIIKNKDFSMRSSFEKEMPNFSTDKTYAASSFTSKEVAGLKKFSGTETAFHSKDFAGAGKKNSTADKAAHEATQQNQLASRLFRTPDSRFDSKMSQDSAKTYTQAGETFATRDNPAGKREMDKNKKPVIADPDKPTYSEEEVKRLLNKS